MLKVSRWRIIFESLMDRQMPTNCRQVKHLNQAQHCFTRDIRAVNRLNRLDEPACIFEITIHLLVH